jgi:hypothetical protein
MTDDIDISRLRLDPERLRALHRELTAPGPTVAQLLDRRPAGGCAKSGFHIYGRPDRNGWRTCEACGHVRVTSD